MLAECSISISSDDPEEDNRSVLVVIVLADVVVAAGVVVVVPTRNIALPSKSCKSPATEPATSSSTGSIASGSSSDCDSSLWESSSELSYRSNFMRLLGSRGRSTQMAKTMRAIARRRARAANAADVPGRHAMTGWASLLGSLFMQH